MMTKSVKFKRLSAEQARVQAFPDLIDGLMRYEAWLYFAFNDLRIRFRRSMLGPIWITLSMAIMIGTMAFVFSTLYNQDINKTLTYIATGLIFWSLLTSCITEGSSAFIDNGNYISNVQSPLSVYLYRVIARNFLIFIFNSIIFLFLFLQRRYGRHFYGLCRV